jgi:hypothetical protein
MKLALLAALPLLAAPDTTRDRSDLAVLYIAEPGPSWAARRAGFEEFLRARFASVEVILHGELDDARAAGADVVLLDWHQGTGGDDDPSPLGAREAWTKPTVLLGSAGLRTAKKWEVLGGSG